MNEPNHDPIISRLETWDWPPGRQAARRFPSGAVVKWAALAALTTAVFFFGRHGVRTPDLETWRTEQAEATRSQIAGLADALDRTRQEDRRAWLTALDRLQARQTADLLSLRRDLETVAMTAEERLLKTQQSLVLLASGRENSVNQ